MKKKVLLICMLVYNFCISQNNPPEPPKNVIATANQISGNADPTTSVQIDIDGITSSITVNFKGYFEQKFTPALTKKADGKLPEISVWSVDETGKESTKLPLTIETSEIILDKAKLGTIILPVKSTPIVNPEIFGIQPVSSTFNYKVTMLNTNFTIPIARFNLTKSDGETSKEGDILLFNSIGAGVGISWGELEKTTDANGETINTEFTSTIGIHLGVLFSAGSNSTENKNVFAPTISLSLLDFQLGYGYEMGTLATNQKKGFFTVAYAIPLSKLVKGKFYILNSSKGYNSKNPLKDENATNTSVNKFI